MCDLLIQVMSRLVHCTVNLISKMTFASKLFKGRFAFSICVFPTKIAFRMYDVCYHLV